MKKYKPVDLIICKMVKQDRPVCLKWRTEIVFLRRKTCKVEQVYTAKKLISFLLISRFFLIVLHLISRIIIRIRSATVSTKQTFAISEFIVRDLIESDRHVDA